LREAGTTALESIALPNVADVAFSSGNKDVAPVMWYEDTDPLYVADGSEARQYVLTGIVDIPSSLLPADAEALRVTFTINVAAPSSQGDDDSGNTQGNGNNNQVVPGSGSGSINSESIGDVNTPLTSTPDDWINPFSDVHESDWFYEAVKYAHQRGVVNGTSATTFSPQVTMTRGMMVMILWNYDGKSQAESAAFSDVPDDAWYAAAVNWAAANGIVAGYGDGRFCPNDEITREQMAVMLFNYTEYIDIELPKNRAGTFADDTEISFWAKEAVAAMYAAEIINGKGQNNFDPHGKATRAEVVTMMRSFLVLFDV